MKIHSAANEKVSVKGSKKSTINTEMTFDNGTIKKHKMLCQF